MGVAVKVYFNLFPESFAVLGRLFAPLGSLKTAFFLHLGIDSREKSIISAPRKRALLQSFEGVKAFFQKSFPIRLLFPKARTKRHNGETLFCHKRKKSLENLKTFCMFLFMQDTTPDKQTLFGTFDGLRGHEIEMTLEEAQSCSHQGQCDQDVEFLLKQPHIKSQFANFTADQIKESLKESGAWEDEDLQDEETNQQRALCFAACDIAENHK